MGWWEKLRAEQLAKGQEFLAQYDALPETERQAFVDQLWLDEEWHYDGLRRAAQASWRGGEIRYSPEAYQRMEDSRAGTGGTGQNLKRKTPHAIEKTPPSHNR